MSRIAEDCKRESAQAVGRFGPMATPSLAIESLNNLVKNIVMKKRSFKRISLFKGVHAASRRQESNNETTRA
ncbi:hypothetical protein [Solidesulfovibrio fructosivorans]|uniref:hypothetical protein n=1 Tax=Solidesulfovibrio fructosivorans TaxID=878 RepID=UPI001305121A|nr:hypothetical protein [Solidesulfovibrio fructosivorans]